MLTPQRMADTHTPRQTWWSAAKPAKTKYTYYSDHTHIEGIKLIWPQCIPSLNLIVYHIAYVSNFVCVCVYIQGVSNKRGTFVI